MGISIDRRLFLGQLMAIANATIPAGNVPLVDGGTGILTTYGRNLLIQLLNEAGNGGTFTQAGTGAIPITIGEILGLVFVPEMFGAVSAPLGTPAASIPDSTAAIQLAINALEALGGGTLLFGPGAYACNVVNITKNNVFIRGSGVNATTIVHVMTAPSTLFNFNSNNPAAQLSQTGISDLAIGSADIVFNKIAISATDVSWFYVNNISIAHYPVDGSMYRGAGTIGTGLMIQGRELVHVENFQAYANLPIVIAANPNITAGYSMLDSATFTNLLLVTFIATNSCITMNGGSVTNINFDGTQNWIGGLHGLDWTDTTTASISQGLYLSGIKSEQQSGTTGYTVHISMNDPLYGLTIANGQGGDRNAIYLKNVINTKIDNFYYDPSVPGSGKIGLNIGTSDRLVELLNCIWQTGTTLTNSPAMTLQSGSITLSGFAATIPSVGNYTS